MFYRKSKSLNGDKVVYIARVKKSGPVIARAETEEELDELLAERNGVTVNEVVEQEDEVVEVKPKKTKNGRKSSKILDSLRSGKS